MVYPAVGRCKLKDVAKSSRPAPHRLCALARLFDIHVAVNHMLRYPCTRTSLFSLVMVPHPLTSPGTFTEAGEGTCISRLVSKLSFTLTPVVFSYFADL